MRPWIWRTIIIILAIAFVPTIVSEVASLVAAGIHEVSQNIHSLLRPFSMTGGARLKGIIELCLYLIAITLLVQVLFRK